MTRKELFKEAQKQTAKSIGKFITKVMSKKDLTYDTVVDAISACALAGVHAADNEPNGGITNFQAGFVMWNFVREYLGLNDSPGLKLVDYNDMLYPQNESKFDKVISESTWKEIQKVAALKIKEEPLAHFKIIAHWQAIVNGVVPFGFTIKKD